MKKEDLKKLKLPLSNKAFIKLRRSIRTKKVKWLDMSKDLMFAYLDFFKSDKIKNLEDTLQD